MYTPHLFFFRKYTECCQPIAFFFYLITSRMSCSFACNGLGWSTQRSLVNSAHTHSSSTRIDVYFLDAEFACEDFMLWELRIRTVLWHHLCNVALQSFCGQIIGSSCTLVNVSNYSFASMHVHMRARACQRTREYIMRAHVRRFWSSFLLSVGCPFVDSFEAEYWACKAICIASAAWRMWIF